MPVLAFTGYNYLFQIKTDLINLCDWFMALIVETPDKVSAKCEYIGDIETLPKIENKDRNVSGFLVL